MECSQDPELAIGAWLTRVELAPSKSQYSYPTSDNIRQSVSLISQRQSTYIRHHHLRLFHHKYFPKTFFKCPTQDIEKMHQFQQRMVIKHSWHFDVWWRGDWAEDRQEHWQQMCPKIGREMKQKSENNNFAPPCHGSGATLAHLGAVWHLCNDDGDTHGQTKGKLFAVNRSKSQET